MKICSWKMKASSKINAALPLTFFSLPHQVLNKLENASSERQDNVFSSQKKNTFAQKWQVDIENSI